MQPLMVLTTIEQIQALAHPVRQGVLRQISDTPRTNKQMADLLDISPGRLHFHVRELERAGLIEIVEQRRKGGIEEKYYLATARSYTLGDDIGVTREAGETLVNSTLASARSEYVRTVNRLGRAPAHLSIHNSEAFLSEAEADEITALHERMGEIFRNADAVDHEEGDGRTQHFMTMLFHTGASKDIPDSAPKELTE